MQESLNLQELHPAFRILKEAVENTNEAFVTIDENHTVVFFNKAAERIFGYSRDEVIGKDLNTILSPTCSKDHRLAVSRYLATRQPTLIGHGTEMQAARKNGEVFPLSISFSVAEIEGRSYFTGIIADLTDTKALREQVSKAERLAALGQIVAEITHDMKGPLLVIGAYARQILRAVEDEKIIPKLKTVISEVERMERLLGEVNEYYLPRKMNVGKFDMNALLQEVCTETRQAGEEQALEIECLADPRPAWVEGDKDKWKQAVLNVIKNGVEALENGGKITMKSVRRNGRIQVQIADNGRGIPEDHLGKIFTPFFTTKSGGTGLGLPICKRIIEDHPGSSIDLTSREGKGTVVTLAIPLQPSVEK